MKESVKNAIDVLTTSLGSKNHKNQSTRAEKVVDACALVQRRMGLDFTENLLLEQLGAVSASKEFIGFINILGLAFYRKVQYDLAIACFKFRISKNPDDKVAYNNLGLSYNRLGKSVEAATAYSNGLKIDRLYKQAGSNLLYLRHYIWGADPESISSDHKAYAETHYGSGRNYMVGREVDLDPGRLLHLGFLSGDLRFHAVSRFVEGIFSELDRRQFEIYVYHTYDRAEDSISEKLKSYQLTWRRVNKLSVDEITELIQSDRIDILLDLAVYTQGGLPDLIARQVAPLQINYLGYPDTSGIPAMHCRLTDYVSDPEGVDHLYSEKLIRLPAPMWNYTPWPNLPDPNPAPCLNNDHVTFGSMNNHAKLQPQWLKVWAKVLRQVPGSRLLLKSRAMNSDRIAEEVFSLFNEYGVSRDRVIARGFESRPNDHFLTFHDIDICLDSVPYNGTTTTFDSLWMGVPVATMTGSLHVSRTTASILTQMGMTDWIAGDPDQFIEICQRHASDKNKLNDLRGQLRQTMRRTTLGDPAAFCRLFEMALRELWKSFCEDRPVTAKSGANQVLEREALEQIGDLRDHPQPNISIVVCSSSPENLEIHKRHIAETIGVPWEYIGIDNSGMHYSLARAYNEGGGKAKSGIIVFVHDDVFFATKNWGKILLSKFEEVPEIGLIGVAGTAYFQSTHPFWVASKAPFIHGRVIHHTKQLRISRYSEQEWDQPVVAIDGLMMAVRRSVFEQNPFDQATFDGFHFYDMDFSLRVSETSNVIVTQDILVKHLSAGKFDDIWKEYRDRFRNKYPGNKVWSCAEGVPEKDSHLQRLECHYPLDSEFDLDELENVKRLGIAHPKHPEYRNPSVGKT